MSDTSWVESAAGAELVVLTLPGVQRYIAESRSTADLVSASTQVAALARVAAQSLRDGGAQVVIPASGLGASVDGVAAPGGAAGEEFGGVPNRIVAVVPWDGAGPRGRELAEAASAVVRAHWDRWVVKVFDGERPVTAGFPDPQWVCVAAMPGGYREQFLRAQEVLAARRRVRSFPAVVEAGRQLCALSARWPAESSAPARARVHERRERLSAVNWVKRLAPHRVQGRPRTPSTVSIATAPYRAEVLTRLGEPAVRAALVALHAVAGGLVGAEAFVPGLPSPVGLPRDVEAAAWWLRSSGGGWVDAERWQEATVREAEREQHAGPGAGSSVDVAAGRRAAQALAGAVGRAPGTHVAVVLQDLDSMGLFLSGQVLPSDAAGLCPVEPGSHAAVSARLGKLAAAQVRAATAVVGESEGGALFGVPVYAGGDDLLMLAPAATALRLAEAVHDLVPGDLPSASTAVLFFSRSASLQQAIRSCHALLDEAKALPGKHGLAVGFQRRTGGSHRSVQSWRRVDGAVVTQVFTGLSAIGGDAGRLSPRLVFDLARDAPALAGLLDGRDGQLELLRAEVRRLVLRHSGVKPASPSMQEPPRMASEGQGGDSPDAGEQSRARAAVCAFADLLVDLGRAEARGSGREGGFDPVPAARVGVFLRQEAR